MLNSIVDDDYDRFLAFYKKKQKKKNFPVDDFHVWFIYWQLKSSFCFLWQNFFSHDHIENAVN